jgi:SAM-dependent methyltransferase
MTICTIRTTCRSCGGSELEPVLSLGETPLANALIAPDAVDDTEERFPLDLVFCRTCALVQITEDVPPEILFRDYVYFSSFSDTVLENARAIATRLADERTISLVVEIASNDGYLLQHYAARGVPVLGIEPARNIAEVAREKGIDTIAEFFTEDFARELVAHGKRADVIHANNVLAHVADLHGFIAGIAALLRDDGVAVIEVPYLRELIEQLEFDTIYHEHLCYFSLTALDTLFARHGLTIFDVERLPIHGGSLRIFAGREERRESVLRLLEEERAWGVATADAYLDFGARVRALCATLRTKLAELKRDGARIAAYGASAKGTTLLSFSGVGSELDFVADRSTAKQGKLTPGTRLPIVPPEELVARMPDYVLLLAWNFAPEIMRQQDEYRRRGGKFIVPVPEVAIL